MPVNQDTDRTQAIHIKHISHRWLKELDEAVGALQMHCPGNFDLFASLNVLGYPVVSRITAPLRKIKSKLSA